MFNLNSSAKHESNTSNPAPISLIIDFVGAGSGHEK